MDNLAELYYQNQPIFIFVGVMALSFLWGAVGTAQRRRRLKQAFFGTGKEAHDVIDKAIINKLIEQTMSIIEEGNALRKRCLYTTLAIICFLLGSAFFVLFFYQGEPNPVLFIIGFFILFLPNRFYKKHIKKLIMVKIAKHLGFRYQLNGVRVFQHLLAQEDSVRKSVGKTWFSSSRSNSMLLGEYERCSIEDGFESENIKVEEVKTWNESKDSKGKKNKDIKFEGLIIEFCLNKPFECPILLREDLGGIGNHFSFAPKGLERVSLEDPTFESFFEVFAPDQIQARRVLTPRFMEKINDIINFYPEGRVTAFMNEQSLFLALHVHKNMFEIGNIWTPVESPKSLGSLMAQLELQKQVYECLI